MVKVELSVFINCPVEEVFAFFADPAKKLKWQGGLTESGFSPGNVPGAGAEIFEKRKFMGMEVTSKFKITQYELNKLLTTKLTEGPIGSEVCTAFEAAGGGTKISTICQWDLSGHFKLMETRVEKQLRVEMQNDYERLKNLLEG